MKFRRNKSKAAALSLGMDGLSVYLYGRGIYTSWAVCLLRMCFPSVSGCIVNQRDLTAVHGFRLQGETHVQLSRTYCNRTRLEKHVSSEMPC